VRYSALLLLLATATTSAHAAEWTAKQAAGRFVIELRVNPRPPVLETPMFFAVTTREGRPVSTSGAKGRAEFSSGGLKGVATLHHDGENRLKGYGLMSAKTDLRIEVTITFPGEPPVRMVFMPLRNESPRPPD